MKKITLVLLLLPFVISCISKNKNRNVDIATNDSLFTNTNDSLIITVNDSLNVTPIKFVKDLLKPIGYSSILSDEYSKYFQQFPLKLNEEGKQETRVYNIDNEFIGEYPFLLDIDLLRFQDCAALVMRLHVESQINIGKQATIHSSQNTYTFEHSMPTDRELIAVYSLANSATIERHDLKKITIDDIRPGDVIGKGGNPGHIAVIMDVIKDGDGNKKFCVAQSYLPARNPHFVYGHNDIWFDVKKIIEDDGIDIDGWPFRLDNILRFKERE